MKHLLHAAILVLFCLLSVGAYATETVNALNQQAESKLNQQPAEAMSLATQAKDEAVKAAYKKGEARAITLMGVAAYKVDDYEKSSLLILQSLDLAEQLKDTTEIAFAKYWKANLELNRGQYAQALDLYQSVLEISTAVNDKKNMARALDGKATIYEALNETDKALEFYQQSLKTAQEANFIEWYPGINFSLANIALSQGKTDEAIAQFNTSIQESEAVGNINNKANCLQQLASIYYSKNDSKKAMDYVQQAMEFFQQTGSQSSFSYSRLLMSTILLQDKEYDMSIDMARMSLEEGKAKDEAQLQKDAAEVLYYAYNAKGDKAKALEYHILFHQLSEKAHNQDLAKKLTRMELQSKFENERKIAAAQRAASEAELNAQIENQKLMKKASLIGIGLLSVIALLAIFAFFQKQKDNRLIAAEKKKSDELLLNILPAEIAQELKDSGKSKAKNYERATVLFADIKNFTGAAESMNPEQLVEEIDFYFQKFDNIVGKYNIEKIKTIGDAYLCVGGLPVPDHDNAINVVQAALDMQIFMEQVQQQRKQEGKIYFEIRIGIHTGPLVAGIVGLRKFAYDIWGDTVNVAARMEQHGEEGRINITGSTYELVKDKFACTYRGKIEAKNKGEIDMYFVDRVL